MSTGSSSLTDWPKLARNSGQSELWGTDLARKSGQIQASLCGGLAKGAIGSNSGMCAEWDSMPMANCTSSTTGPTASTWWPRTASTCVRSDERARDRASSSALTDWLFDSGRREDELSRSGPRCVRTPCAPGRASRRQRSLPGFLGVRDQDRATGGGGLANPHAGAPPDSRDEPDHRRGTGLSLIRPTVDPCCPSRDIRPEILAAHGLQEG